MSKKGWNRPAPTAPAGGPGQSAPVIEPQSPEEAAAETRRRLEDPGWCLWECSVLAGEVIVVVRDELVTGYPPGYPVYTIQEITELTKLDDAAIRLAHEAKKELGCTVTITEDITKEMAAAAGKALAKNIARRRGGNDRAKV